MTEQTKPVPSDPAPVSVPVEQGLYAKHQKVHPRRVTGTFRRLKTRVLWGLMALFLITPWLRWDRGPGVPDQAVLFDFVGMRAWFFDIEIWPQEFYFLTGILVLASIGLFLATTLLGRIWCGYACPQTVWTDIFVWIEEKLEGDRNSRLRLDAGPWNADKIVRKTIKHALWIAVSAATGAWFIFYFADTPTSLRELTNGSAGEVMYGFFALFAIGTYVMAGWTREQMCTYMCPWPRIQAGMLDERSVVVSYNAERGEARGHAKRGQSFDGRGHCVDCKICVQVCPTGIDIRNGLQLECIGCGLCIDGCNSVMSSFGLPPNLIGWSTGKRKENWVSLVLRPRSLLYVGLLALTLVVMAIGAAFRVDFDMNVLRDRTPVYVRLSTGAVRNAYTVKISNHLRQQQTLHLDVAGVPGVVLSVVGQDNDGDPARVVLRPDNVETYRVMLTAPSAADRPDQVPVTFVLSDPSAPTQPLASHKSVFISGGQ